MTHLERIVPDETEPGIVALHLKRYAFALPFCEGRDVLDVGCGTGYGSSFLAERARSVVGVDVSEQALEYARGRYGRANVVFRVMDAARLELADASFDVVCAFETIEHLDDRERHLAEIARVLRPDGAYIVSTPRAEQTTTAPENPFHRIEYSAADFEALLRVFFDDVALHGQRRLQTRRHRAMQRGDVFRLRARLGFLRPMARLLLGTRPTADLRPDDVVISTNEVERATELVAVCRRPRRA